MRSAIEYASRCGRSSGCRKRARAQCRCNRARAALLLRLHLQDVAVVYRSAPLLRRLALADVADRFDLLAQRRRLGGTRVQLAIDGAFILGGRLEIEEMSARVAAATENKDDIAVLGVLKRGVSASARARVPHTCASCGRLPVSMSALMSTPAACKRSHLSTSCVSSRRRPFTYASFACCKEAQSDRVYIREFEKRLLTRWCVCSQLRMAVASGKATEACGTNNIALQRTPLPVDEQIYCWNREPPRWLSNVLPSAVIDG